MSLEWRARGTVGEGPLISTITAGSLPMVTKDSPGFAYFTPPPDASNPSLVPLGGNANSVNFYYSTIGGTVSTIANPSGAVLPLVIQASVSRPYFTD